MASETPNGFKAGTLKWREVNKEKQDTTVELAAGLEEKYNTPELNEARKLLSAGEMARIIAASQVERAMFVTIAIMENTVEETVNRLKAVQIVLERGAGKPQTYVNGVADDFKNLPTTEAYDRLVNLVMTGRVSLEQAEVIKGLLESKVQIDNVAELEQTIADLTQRLDQAIAGRRVAVVGGGR